MAASQRNLSGKSFKILHVEDDLGDAHFLEVMLRDSKLENVSLHHVDRLHEALRHLREHSVDLIFLDVELPDAVAVKFDVVAIRRCSPAPIVLMTGLDRHAVKGALERHPSLGFQNKGELTAEALTAWVEKARNPGSPGKLLKADAPDGLPLEALLNSMSDAVIVFDSSGQAHWANTAGWDLLDHEWTDHLKHVLQRKRATPDAVIVDVFDKNAKSSRSFEARLNVFNSEGTDALMIASLRPLRD